MFRLFQNTVYVRIKPDRVSVLQVESGKEYSDIPVLAIERKDGKSSVVAVGQGAETKAGLSNIMLVNGFKHPRTLLADFTVAEQTLKYFLKKVLPVSFLAPSPVIVIHPQAVLEGGLTQIEIRAFAELGSGAGARKVFVWEGMELSKEELRELRFARAGGRLLHPQVAG
jgi:rod shape-determining protein MreB